MIPKIFLKKKTNYIHKKDIGELDFDKLNKTRFVEDGLCERIDDITWQDLNMNNVFCEINNTTTSNGERRLYSWLRNPLLKSEDIVKRNTLLNSLLNKRDELNELRDGLNRIGYFKYDFKNTMNNIVVKSYWILLIMILLALSNIVILAYTFLTTNMTYFLILVFIFGINIFIHNRFKTFYGDQVDAIEYIIRQLIFVRSNRNLIISILPEHNSKIDSIYSKLKSILLKGNFIFKLEGIDILSDYINTTLLVREINFILASRDMEKHRDTIIELYDYIGLLDCLGSIITYRDKIDYFCEPIHDGDNKMSCEGLYHPLLKEPIPVSISIEKSIIITGSNMSGKSTFLRTIGVNAIMSQSICTCLARDYRAGCYRVISSISLNDNIINSKSYFLMEAEAIKRMIDIQYDTTLTLVLIDEIFKGTNPVERLAAGTEILNELEKGNTKVLAATHDLEILTHLSTYDFYYFSEVITSKSLSFDYKIRKGIADKRNAIKILGYLNYPSRILDKINDRIV